MCFLYLSEKTLKCVKIFLSYLTVLPLMALNT